MRWDKRHGKILEKIYLTFSDRNIRYFILRNYQGLPSINRSKDVDIVVDPEKFLEAKQIVKSVYREFELKYYYEARFGYLHCCHGINSDFGIHIDIIGSYVSIGFEIFTFDELYSQTEDYKNFKVLNKYYEGVMIFIYKQFGYSRPKLKEEYQIIIYNTYTAYPEFRTLIAELAGNILAGKIFFEIEQKNFEKMLSYSRELTKALSRYAFKKNPSRTMKNSLKFYWDKIHRIVLCKNNFAKVFSVMAPDGAGKTTFLDAVIANIELCFVNDRVDERCNVYHFRPNYLPNLGELGEKSGLKEQDKDFTNPHRAEPASFISSLVRISYYWLDYVIGYNLFVRKDVQYDKFSVFDRYSYDLLVDPKRTRLNLPWGIRKLFVQCMPHPKVVFFLNASPDVIYERKQELTLLEIGRQNILYNKVAASHKRFITLDSNRPVKESVDDAIRVILDTFTEKL